MQLRKIKIYKSRQKKLYEVNVSEILFNFDLSFDELNQFIKKYGLKMPLLSLVFQIRLQKEVKLGGLT